MQSQDRAALTTSSVRMSKGFPRFCDKENRKGNRQFLRFKSTGSMPTWWQQACKRCVSSRRALMTLVLQAFEVSTPGQHGMPTLPVHEAAML